MTENPYTPPIPGGDPPVSIPGKKELTFGKPVLVLLCIAIAAITRFSTSSGVPEIFSPFPLPVVLPAFFGIPLPVIPIASAALFAASLFHHFKGTPPPRPGVALTILLLAITGLTALWIVAGWSYGLRYQGASHTMAVAFANLVFAGMAWSTWLLAQRPGRYRMQVLFAFTLFAWMFWYALPYLGELP